MIRLIATDLDHTLLASDRTPHPQSAAAIKRAVDAGIVILLASGRIGHSIRSIANSLALYCPAAGCNGADVFGPDDEPWGHFGLDAATVELVLEFAKEHGVQANVYTRQDVFFYGESKWTRRYLERLNQSDDRHMVVPRFGDEDHLRTLDVSKILLIDEPERIQRLRRTLEPQLNPHAARVTESEPEYLEFLAKSASKGAALKAVCERCGIDLSETAAIGDFMNDAEMLEMAGFAGAVGNALPGIQRIADVTVATNDEGGVGEFIDGILDGRWLQ